MKAKKPLLLVVFAVVLVILLLVLSVPALAAQPTTKDVGIWQLQSASVGLAGDLSGYLEVGQSNANIPGVDTAKGGIAFCDFEDSAAGILIQANEDPLAPNRFAMGKGLNNAKLTIPAAFTHDLDVCPGTVEVRWEGVGDIGSYPDSWSARSPEPPGPWSLLEKGSISLEDRLADVTVTVKCRDLDYEKTVTAPSPQGYMAWILAEHVQLVK
jgi:hypothetical protein